MVAVWAVLVALLGALERILARRLALGHRPRVTVTQLPTQMHLGTYLASYPSLWRSRMVANHIHSLLADTGDHPGSPPSTHASPALSKATLDTVAAGTDKKD